jgi:hypothetical protein
MALVLSGKADEASLSSYKHWLAAHRARLRIKSAGYVTAPDKSGFGRKSPIYRALFCSPAIYRGAVAVRRARSL